MDGDALIRAFGNTIRTPPRTIYVLDLSGSMSTVDALDPARLDQPNPPMVSRTQALRHALLSLTGADTSLAAIHEPFRWRMRVASRARWSSAVPVGWERLRPVRSSIRRSRYRTVLR